jgi:hypothetical protein
MQSESLSFSTKNSCNVPRHRDSPLAGVDRGWVLVDRASLVNASPDQEVYPQSLANQDREEWTVNAVW